jgi:hypothetical protein
MSETSALVMPAERLAAKNWRWCPHHRQLKTHRPVPHYEIVKVLIETGFATSESSTTNVRSRRMV